MSGIAAVTAFEFDMGNLESWLHLCNFRIRLQSFSGHTFVLVLHLIQDVAHGFQAGLVAIIAFDDDPRAVSGRGSLKHRFLVLRIFIPFGLREGVYSAQCPLLERISLALLDALGLFTFIDGKSEFHHMQAIFLEHALEQNNLLHKELVFPRRTKAHHRLDHGAVVPAAVKENDLPRVREFFHIALKVPLARFLLAGFGQGEDSVIPGVQEAHKAHDCASFPRCVAAFKNNQQSATTLSNRVLQAHHLNL